MKLVFPWLMFSTLLEIQTLFLSHGGLALRLGPGRQEAAAHLRKLLGLKRADDGFPSPTRRWVGLPEQSVNRL